MVAGSRVYDVVVVGAGPAGSLSAYRLATAGLSVLVMDAVSFPRDKPCGGGVQERARSRIPFNWDEVSRGSVKSVTFTFRLGQGFTKAYPDPLVTMVRRSEFDQFLLERARTAGASVLTGVRALGTRALGKTLTEILTSSGNFVCRYAVGADGANSRLAQEINQRSTYYWQTAIRAELPITPAHDRDSQLRIDWGSLPAGYGWVFPKDGSVNVGVGGPVRVAKLLRSYLGRFAENGFVDVPVLPDSIQGHQLPSMTARTSFSKGRLLLVGDSAGMIDPLTGEGISIACHGAELAANAILKAQGCSEDLEIYSKQIRSEILPEILMARAVLSVAVAFPKAFYRIMQSSDCAWHAFCKYLRGEIHLADFRDAVLGSLKVVWHPLRFLAGLREALSVRRPVSLDHFGG